jgi:hypothetical protein
MSNLKDAVKQNPKILVIYCHGSIEHLYFEN